MKNYLQETITNIPCLFDCATDGQRQGYREGHRDALYQVLEAIANKATEEGELPVAPWTERHSAFETPDFSKMARMEAEIADWREYFRASRQGSSVPDCFANKAEVEPVAYCAPDKKGKPLFGKGWMFSPVEHLQATMPLYATPPATTGGANATPTGASTVRDQALEDAAVIADSFYDHIRQYTTDVPGIGGAIRALKGSVGASTAAEDLLTDAIRHEAPK